MPHSSKLIGKMISKAQLNVGFTLRFAPTNQINVFSVSLLNTYPCQQYVLKNKCNKYNVSLKQKKLNCNSLDKQPYKNKSTYVRNAFLARFKHRLMCLFGMSSVIVLLYQGH